MTITIAITEAKIGRSMKKCDIRMASSVLRLRGGRGAGRALFLRIDLDARTNTREPIHDNAVVRRKSILDDALPFEELAKRHVFRRDRVVVLEHHHVFAHLL